MSFDALLGNEQLKKNLSRSLEKGHVSHFYLISGPEGSGKHTLASMLSAAIVCRGQQKPCGSCGPCRKVFAGQHPDVITVDDPDNKTVTVKAIREARADMFVLPNESDYKIYVFPRAQDIRPEGQNALLKVLEEPPSYGVFLLLTDNPDKMLPTIRSRCTELRLTALPQEMLLAQLQKDFPQAGGDTLAAAASRSGGYLGQAKALLESGDAIPEQTRQLFEALCQRSALGLTRTLVPMEKWKRDALIPMLQSWISLLEEALAQRCGSRAISPLAQQLAAARSTGDIYTAIGHLRKAADYTQSNVSPAAVCGYLAWALR